MVGKRGIILQEVFMGQAHKKSMSFLPELITDAREAGKCSFSDVSRRKRKCVLVNI